MKIDKLKLVCFSPTGTTKAVIQGIARGINHDYQEVLDITNPLIRQDAMQTSANDLLIVGVPVYMGRVPAIIGERLSRIKANSTPTVCVVVYGNRLFDDALLELTNILTKQGCKPFAGAAFVGEHSFSSAETPIAESRPDSMDLYHAEQFGKRIIAKLQMASSTNSTAGIDVPGKYPYGGVAQLWSVDFIGINSECNQCGICAEVCPANAIDSTNSRIIDKEKCITCCACIKKCPMGARFIKDSPVKEAAVRLNRLYSERKDPIVFI